MVCVATARLGNPLLAGDVKVDHLPENTEVVGDECLTCLASGRIPEFTGCDLSSNTERGKAAALE
jgi:hypothetical protein